MTKTDIETTRSLLVAAATLTVIALAISLYGMVGMGVFHADYYYLPLRQFVSEEQRYSMEQLVIDLYDRLRIVGPAL